MALSIGKIAEEDQRQDILARARARASLVPDMLVEARRIANTVVGGWHGRKRRGIGDTFWQFRPYDLGESLSRIDWRRSARDDSITIRDQEWEAAHTVWVWADRSRSMKFQSDLSTVSKQSRALVLALALTEVLARSGERVGWPGLTNAISSRNAAEKLATEIMGEENRSTLSFPPASSIRSRSELVVFSDFLDPNDETVESMYQLASRDVRGTLVQIIDPAEEVFPYSGRTQFEDPETGLKFTSGRAQDLSEDYSRLFQARKQQLSEKCQKIGWQHIVHHTDNLASSALVDLHIRLTGETI